VNFAIVGCGLIGKKRAKGLLSAGHRLVAVADADASRARALVDTFDKTAEVAASPQAAIIHPQVQAVIVATTNDALTPLALAAVEAGKHVLVEKPAARSAAELMPLIERAAKIGVIVKVGFNLRFHPALQQARELFDSGVLGPLMYIRARYGHGGRLGMEREWRADPLRAGGGELIDQGVHLIDLARWFAGDFADVRGTLATCFWDMPVEDNAFVELRTGSGQIAWLHASCTEWKNLFSFEIYARDGKLQIDGLGGSYGPERLTWYRMLPQMGPPETQTWEYPEEDVSFERELVHFVRCIEGAATPLGGLDDALASLRIIDRLYDEARRATKRGGKQN
jgi:predicted dehydrogenase